MTANLRQPLNVSITINQDKSVTLTLAGTAGAGIEGFVGATASNVSRNDGYFSEVCSSVGGYIVGGVCAGANLERKAPLAVTGKLGSGVAAFAGANIGYQKTFNLKSPK
ncbi:hypothetical protein [Neisseria weaveri]|uniref:hypothetical protein n=1 Tax=Neisseria weaveri TaxID=28091 RepID=UPI0005669F8C|nr:hypothetical protein [Neisseria weaveri]